jgi:23S rRNA (pseudouridine1915-N3)-methyltransferase
MNILILSPAVKMDSSEQALFKKYAKRIGDLRSKLEVAEIAAAKYSSTTLNQAKEQESKLILVKLLESDFVVLLDQTGQRFNNLEFAAKLNGLQSSGAYKRIVFIVGGAYGTSELVHSCADLIWSFSEQVFPHKLFRIMLLEQIYRTLSILNGSNYHH